MAGRPQFFSPEANALTEGWPKGSFPTPLLPVFLPAPLSLLFVPHRSRTLCPPFCNFPHLPSIVSRRFFAKRRSTPFSPAKLIDAVFLPWECDRERGSAIKNSWISACLPLINGLSDSPPPSTRQQFPGTLEDDVEEFFTIYCSPPFLFLSLDLGWKIRFFLLFDSFFLKFFNVYDSRCSVIFLILDRGRCDFSFRKFYSIQF